MISQDAGRESTHNTQMSWRSIRLCKLVTSDHYNYFILFYVPFLRIRHLHSFLHIIIHKKQSTCYHL